MALCDRQKTVWGFDELLFITIMYTASAGGSSLFFRIDLFIILSKIIFYNAL